MKVALDTSVVVAALVEAHPCHARALWWVGAARSRSIETCMAWHGFVETWAVLTRLPAEPKMAPATAHAMVDRLRRRVRPLTMTAPIYRAALRRSADRGLRSGTVFDALHLVAAEAARVEAFLTFNGSDFERLAGESSPRIAAPPDPPGPLRR